MSSEKKIFHASEQDLSKYEFFNFFFFFFSNEAAHPIFVGAARSELLFLGHEQPWGKPSLRAGGLGRLRKEEDSPP